MPRIGSCFAILIISASISLTGTLSSSAQEVVPDRVTVTTDKTLINDLDQTKKLHAKFKNLLTGAKLSGQFTIDGKPMNDLHEETYEIEKVEKLEGDTWVITARIKYGKNDLSFPVPLEVKWAGTTPVLTLDNMTIPGFGTFGARVVFHKDKYAGTWQHDDVGGHMFGKIILAESEDEPSTEE